MTDNLTESLLQAIDARDATIGIVGLGYVGLPLALIAAETGFRVLGFDVDAGRVAKLMGGQTGIKHITDARLQAAQETGRLEASTDMTRLVEADVILIAVPTPLSQTREPDLSFVISSTEAVAKTLRRGQIIVLESTTWPGTTTEVVKPILEGAGLEAGQDFFLGFSPEREDPGNPDFDIATMPKVVGADDAGSQKLLAAVYGTFASQVVTVSSSAAAEATKLTENIFRSVNIALVNELKLIYEKMDVDVWEVIDAAKTKPFGFMPFYPGPGLGGHCIPIDPFYLSWRARKFDQATRFIELAGEINAHMPTHVVNALAQALDQRQSKGLNGARILLLGLAYKRNVDDLRESPALKLFRTLQDRNAQVDYHDPWVPKVPDTRAYRELAGFNSVDLSEDAIASYDAVLVVTDHDVIDWPLIAKAATLILDTRNVFARHGLSCDKIVKA